DEGNTALRMLGDAQTSSLVLIGEAGAGKSMLAALLYRRIEMVIGAGQAPIRHLVWLSLGPNATLPDVIAVILREIEIADKRKTGAGNVGVGFTPARASPAPT